MRIGFAGLPSPAVVSVFARGSSATERCYPRSIALWSFEVLVSRRQDIRRLVALAFMTLVFFVSLQ